MGLFDDIKNTVVNNPLTAGAIGGAGLAIPGLLAGNAGKDMIVQGLGNAFNGVVGPGGAPLIGANIMNPATLQQSEEQYQQSQDALAKQQAFMNALQAQGNAGITNQGSVYNQLQSMANAPGVSVAPSQAAQAQLAQATGANIANQAAMMAAQRGSGVNAGLLARQAAMQGAQTQQQAAGQAANLQAQQDYANAQLNAQLALQNRAQQAAALGQMGGMNAQQAQLAAQAGQAYTGAAQQGQQNILNSIANQNQAQVGAQGSLNSANAQLQAGQNQNRANLIGNLMGTAGTIAGGVFGGPAGAIAGGAVGRGAGGGISASGGESSSSGGSKMYAFAAGGAVGPKSFVGKHFHGVKMAQGGQVPAMVSPGETYLNPTQVKQVAQGANPLAVGEKIPGKPKVPGNSYQNDTVKKNLQEGGIIIPNSVMQSDSPAKNAANFVDAILSKQGKLPAKRK